MLGFDVKETRVSIIKAIRGMNDVLPEQSWQWQILEQNIGYLFASYGYQQIRMPIVESTSLFKRGIGEVTDIVEKEMYSFDDRNGEGLTLRPEGTASCVRAVLEHGLSYNQTAKLWYQGPMFRYERPQKGRYRQFHQIGVEAFGIAGPEIEAELILMTARLWAEWGLSQHLVLQINSLGSSQARAAYRQALVDYLQPLKEQLDEDSQRRLSTNPLRILDSKVAQTQALLAEAPKLHDFLDDESKAEFAELLRILDQCGQPYEINDSLVRGLDYYNKTVFEWVTDRLGAQGTVCAGGRYDGLVPQLGGKPTPAAGFAMGVERLLLLLNEIQAFDPAWGRTCDLYLVAVGDEAQKQQAFFAENLRNQLPGCRLMQNLGGGSLKSQLKRADKSGARIAIILGESEVQSKTASLKPLRIDAEQQTLAWAELPNAIIDLLEQ